MTSEPVLASLAIRRRRLPNGAAATGWTVAIAGGLTTGVLDQDSSVGGVSQHRYGLIGLDADDV